MVYNPNPEHTTEMVWTCEKDRGGVLGEVRVAGDGWQENLVEWAWDGGYELVGSGGAGDGKIQKMMVMPSTTAQTYLYFIILEKYISLEEMQSFVDNISTSI